MLNKKIQEELDKVQQAEYARKTDKQLWAYERLSRLHNEINKGEQPICLRDHNFPEKRKSKLSRKIADEIRKKYIPHIYGKQRLAREYGVSTSVVYRILKGISWK